MSNMQFVITFIHLKRFMIVFIEPYIWEYIYIYTHTYIWHKNLWQGLHIRINHFLWDPHQHVCAVQFLSAQMKPISRFQNKELSKFASSINNCLVGLRMFNLYGDLCVKLCGTRLWRLTLRPLILLNHIPSMLRVGAWELNISFALGWVFGLCGNPMVLRSVVSFGLGPLCFQLCIEIGGTSCCLV